MGAGPALPAVPPLAAPAVATGRPSTPEPGVALPALQATTPHATPTPSDKPRDKPRIKRTILRRNSAARDLESKATDGPASCCWRRARTPSPEISAKVDPRTATRQLRQRPRAVADRAIRKAQATANRGASSIRGPLVSAGHWVWQTICTITDGSVFATNALANRLAKSIAHPVLGADEGFRQHPPRAPANGAVGETKARAHVVAYLIDGPLLGAGDGVLRQHAQAMADGTVGETKALAHDVVHLVGVRAVEASDRIGQRHALAN